jgi:plastocyanin
MAAKLVLATLALLALTLSGCTSSSDAEVGIHGNAFDPATITVKAGTTIHFENHDSVPHAVVANAGASVFSTGNIAAGGDGHIKAPSASGSYPYRCSIHPSMTGTIIVS